MKVQETHTLKAGDAVAVRCDRFNESRPGVVTAVGGGEGKTEKGKVDVDVTLDKERDAGLMQRKHLASPLVKLAGVTVVTLDAGEDVPGGLSLGSAFIVAGFGRCVAVAGDAPAEGKKTVRPGAQ